MPNLLECSREFQDIVNGYIDCGMSYFEAIKQARIDMRNALLPK